jgi:F0F1-type ATP synthase epsilon subunit
MVEEEHTVEKKDVVDPTAAAEAQGQTMHVKVYAPFKTYFDGTASSISAVNGTGPFDVLPKHHYFMTLLSPCEVVVRTQQGEERILISRGIMHVKSDDVVVFLDV